MSLLIQKYTRIDHIKVKARYKLIREKNNNIIRRKKIKLSVKKKVFVTLQRVKYKRRCKYMKGYNFFFSCEWKKQREKDRWRNDSGNMMMMVHWNSELEKREKKWIFLLPFSFLVSRLARTVKSRLGIIDSTRFISLLEHVRAMVKINWKYYRIQKIFLHSSLDYFSTLVVKCSIWIKNTNELFIYGPWMRFK